MAINDGLDIKTNVDVQAAFGQAAPMPAVQLQKDAPAVAVEAQSPSQIFNGGKIPIADGKKLGIV